MGKLYESQTALRKRSQTRCALAYWETITNGSAKRCQRRFEAFLKRYEARLRAAKRFRIRCELRQAGAGIAGLPDYIARTDARLSRVLPEVSGPGFDVYFLYPEELKGSKRLIVFRDFILRAARRFGLR